MARQGDADLHPHVRLPDLAAAGDQPLPAGAPASPSPGGCWTRPSTCRSGWRRPTTRQGAAAAGAAAAGGRGARQGAALPAPGGALGVALRRAVPPRRRHGGRDRPPAGRLAQGQRTSPTPVRGSNRRPAVAGCCCGGGPLTTAGWCAAASFNNNERNVRCAYRNRNNPTTATTTRVSAGGGPRFSSTPELPGGPGLSTAFRAEA